MLGAILFAAFGMPVGDGGYMSDLKAASDDLAILAVPPEPDTNISVEIADRILDAFEARLIALEQHRLSADVRTSPATGLRRAAAPASDRLGSCVLLDHAAREQEVERLVGNQLSRWDGVEGMIGQVPAFGIAREWQRSALSEHLGMREKASLLLRGGLAENPAQPY
jgi:hypothetical protein